MRRFIPLTSQASNDGASLPLRAALAEASTTVASDRILRQSSRGRAPSLWPVLCALFVLTSYAATARGQAAFCLPRETTGSAPGERFGSAIAPLGDLNADGCEDFAVGAPFRVVGTQGPIGQVTVVSGHDLSVIYTVDGRTAFEQFGASLTTIPDRDGDGARELVVGAWGYDGRGRVALFSGATGTSLGWRGGNPGEQMGWALASAGDYNGDGVGDILTGGPGYAFGRGRARVLSGMDLSPLATWDGAQPGEGFGYSVARAGLISSDPIDDLAIGAPFAAGPAGARVGRVEVRDGLSGGIVRSFEGDADNQQFGFSVASLPDRDRDGRNELLVGAPGDDRVAPGAGRAMLMSGDTGALLWARNGTHAAAQFGYRVGSAGDRDGSGTPDFAISAPGYDPGQAPDTGRILVMRNTLATSFEIYGLDSGERFGESLASPARVDDNNREDFIVGAPTRPTPAMGSGVGWFGVFHAPYWRITGVLQIGNPLRLIMSSPPRFDQFHDVRVTDGFSNQPAWIGFSPTAATTLVDQGGGFITEVAITTLPRRVLVMGPEVLDANGETSFPIPVAPLPFLDGCVLYGQALSTDSAGRIIASNRLDITPGW